MSKKMSTNFLDFVPKKSEQHSWQYTSAGRLEIKVRHEGFFAKIAQQIFHRPQTTRLELEGLGAFIWAAIDGKKSVYALGQLVEEAYGKKAHPLYARLSLYVKTLQKLRLIEYVEEK